MANPEERRPVDGTEPPIADTVPEAAESSVEQTEALPEEPAPVEEQIIAPSEDATADVLAAIPKKPSPMEDDDLDPDDRRAVKAAKKAAEKASKKPRRMGIIRFLKAIFPCRGEGVFEAVRKSILLAGVFVFVFAGCLLLEDLYINPMQNSQQVDTIKSQYISGDTAPVLNEAEQNFAYPAGMLDSFKKLYYQNQDIRAWLTYNSTDGTTIQADYPVMWSGDNDYYLNHDFYQTYNKNGSLFFDFRNQFSSPDFVNRNLIIYGHNMASGQMFASLNRLTYGVDYARTAPTFTLDTIYEEAQYKVFAVMIVNSDPADGAPFGYLRTSFSDDVDFANFLAEILARSLYVYGDVDLRPDDNIVTLSTCNTSSEARFTDGRTVVVARRVREGEDPSTDVSKIIYNNDVLMPYAWYRNQDAEPHPYYVDPNYHIEELSSLKSYIEELQQQAQSGSTVPGSPSNVTIPSITIPSTTTSTTVETTTTTKMPTQTTQAQLFTITVNTPVTYTVGDSFDYKNTTVTGWYTNGRRIAINPRHCAITGFSTAHAGSYYVTIHYGQLKASFFMAVRNPESDITQTTTATTPPDQTTVPPEESTTAPITEPTDAPLPPEEQTVAEP